MIRVRQADIFYLLVHSPKGQAEAKPGLLSVFSQPYPAGAEAQGLQPSFTAFPGTLAGGWTGGRAGPELETRWDASAVDSSLTLLCHRTSLGSVLWPRHTVFAISVTWLLLWATV